MIGEGMWIELPAPFEGQRVWRTDREGSSLVIVYDQGEYSASIKSPPDMITVHLGFYPSFKQAAAAFNN